MTCALAFMAATNEWDLALIASKACFHDSNRALAKQSFENTFENTFSKIVLVTALLKYT